MVFVLAEIGSGKRGFFESVTSAERWRVFFCGVGGCLSFGLAVFMSNGAEACWNIWRRRQGFFCRLFAALVWSSLVGAVWR